MKPVIDLGVNVKAGHFVRAGEMLVIPALVTGKPKPSIAWTKDEKEPDKERVEIQEAGDNSTLIIKNAKRSDSGRYQLTAANPSGIKSAWTMVEVVGEYRY